MIIQIKMSLIKKILNIKKIIIENRAQLLPVIKSIILLGQKNIPFVDHHADSVIEKSSAINEGNFGALLNFQIDSGD